ncbi:MAG: RHS repeat domain-containing protein [Moheibacter sp.]
MAAILTAMNLIGQIGGINDPFRDLIPNTPNAAEMTQYGKLEIGEFTGTMQHSIPLYEINYKGIRIPITLNYSSNGVNIDKHESSVGIDWSLNAGGVITRTIMDLADEMASENPETLAFPNPPYPYGGNMEPKNVFFDHIANTETYDMQPDIFTFNILGYSGKFYLENVLSANPVAVMIEPSPVEITILEGFGNLNNQDSDFKIVLPNGIICWFGGIDASDFSSSRSVKSGTPQPPTFQGKNAFYLTKIESPSGAEIVITYYNNNYDRYTGISQSVSANYYIDGTASSAQYSDKSPVMYKSFGTEVMIKDIEWNNNKIEFSYNQKLLNEIIIKHKVQPRIRYTFDYFEEFSDDDFDNDCSYCHPVGYNKRYFLKKVTRKYSSNTSQDEIYQFEYYNPENLPSRFSFARDYWGYFNGKQNDYLVTNDFSKYNQYDYGSEGSQFFNYTLIQNLFHNIGGDRNTDPDYAVYGLLKKISYPTRGWTEIEYEANSYYSNVKYEQTQTDRISTETNGIRNSTEEMSIHSSENQIINIDLLKIMFDDQYETEIGNSCDPADYPWHKAVGILSVRDSNNNVVELFYNPPAGGMPLIYNSYHLSIPAPDFDYDPTEDPLPYNLIENLYFHAHEDEEYTVKLDLKWECLRFFADITYVSEVEYQNENVPFGGMRVKKIINKDSDGSTLEQEEYFYGDLNCLECSNALFEFPKPGFSFIFIHDNPGMGNNNPPPHSIATLSSSSLNNLYFSNSVPIAYSKVSKRKLDFQNKNNGLIVRNYNTILEQTPITNYPLYYVSIDPMYIFDEIFSDWIIGTPYTNGFGNGNLVNEEIYDEQLNLIHKIENYYKFENSFDKSKAGYNISVMGSLEGIPIGYNVNKYFIESKRQFMDYSVEKNYTDDGVLETRTDYYYDGANKLLKSKETITDSNGKTLETTFSYPSDLIGIEQSPYMQQLTDANRIAEPVITRTTKGDKQYLEKHLKYGQNQSTSNLLLPVELHTKKGFNSININNSDDRKLTYTKYDTGGNLLEYLTEDGSPVSLIWGYDSQYPIAKIEGVANTNLPSQKVTVLQNLSDSGQLSAESFYDLINSVDGMVTAYTYEPLVGVKTITQPNGTTAYYEYDDFGRLISVKDTDGNVLKEVQYNFKQ